MSKKAMCASVHWIDFFILTAFLLGGPRQGFAATQLVVNIATGSDDLRGGNTAFIRLVSTDGSQTQEQILSRGEGGGTRSTRQVTFSETVDASEIRSLLIRHDGNPRSGHPFDSYDNWDLSSLQIQLVNASCRSASHILYTSAGDPGFRGVRLTGDRRQIELPVRATIPAFWCTHATAQRLEGDVNGDGQMDAVCHDRSTGKKWVALRESAGLVESWVDPTNHWCSHAGAALFIGDVNGDRRADLICKDRGRIWLDYSAGASGFFRGTGPVVDTTWCTGTGDTLFVGDQNADGRADLVCRSGDGLYRIDFADASGRFGGTTDASGRAPDFEVTDIVRSGEGYMMSIRNNGAEGYAETFWCSANVTPGAHFTGLLRIGPGQTRTHFVSLVSDVDVVTCGTGGRSLDGVREVLTSNNRFTKCMR